MKQPIVASNTEVKYGFKRVSPVGISVKDSSSIFIGGNEYIACTNLSDGGIVIFQDGNLWSTLYKGWRDMWAPCFVIPEGAENTTQVSIVCSDTEGAQPFWQTQRIKRLSPPYYHRVKNIHIESNKGVIDPEIVKIGNFYYMFYVVMDWHNGEWWDVYASRSLSWEGPYTNEHNISQMVEQGIEEAPHYNPFDNMLYWSVKDSEVNSSSRRGVLTMGVLGRINVEEDLKFRMGATGSDICTHPDHNPLTGRFRATLKADNGDFFIAELL